MLKKIISCITAALLLSVSVNVPPAELRPDTLPESAPLSDIPSYGDYLSANSGIPYAADTVELGLTGCTGGAENGDVLVWHGGGSVTYTANIPETALYCLDIDYLPLLSDSTDIELSLTVDGELPYDTANRLVLNRVWVSEHEITTDMRGNQVRPTRVQAEIRQSCFFGDPDGLSAEPLAIVLEKGRHELCFTSERSDIAIEAIRLTAPDSAPPYDVCRGDTAQSGEPKLIRMEGENADYCSSPTLYPTADNTSCNVSPADPVKLVYNTLGGGTWKKALQAATWEFSVEQGGWYRLGIKARQNEMRGFCSNRRVCLDGKVPCRELEQVRFFYGNGWSLTTPQTADGEDIYIYIGEGGHTLTLECVSGETGEFMRRLESAAAELNRYYRGILMITGPTPDKYTDYYVHEKIDGLTDGLARISAELKSIQSGIESLAGTSGSEAAVIGNMAVILDKCTAKPLKIPDYLSQIKDGVTSLSAWIRDYRDQPLELDYIELAAADTPFTDCTAHFGDALSFDLRSFFGSFFEDYTTLSDISAEEPVEVWVALGRDQAQIVRELTENEFIPEYGVPISVSLVTGGIVEASLAGKGPDAALFLGGEFPVNLAARGMLAELSQYGGFDDVLGRFGEGAAVPYQYEGGTYGLPVSRTFPMMFYRTDILAELGIASPPETWDELKNMLPALQRNCMSVGLVLPSANISPATEAGHTFALMLLQNGMNYYNADLTATVFDDVTAVQCFEDWTDLYTKYSFEQSYDAFSRFRTGEYPIIITNYTFFNQLTEAAPEIKGLWDFCSVPGTVRADGTVSHAANSVGSGAVIFSKAADKEGAWEFIKWFTSAGVQAEFGRRTEGLLGVMGRFDTANTEALSKLSWSESELAKLNAQQSELAEIPILPSSYAVTRNVMNAFREVVNSGRNPRDTLIWYDRAINTELARKRQNA